jgi:putative transposase
MEMPGRAGQNSLCADAGYKGAPALNAVVERDYRPHIKQRREEAHNKLTTPGFKARRWVVERTHSWINRFRKLLVSFEKTEASYVALLSLACAMICWRQTVIICGYALSPSQYTARMLHLTFSAMLCTVPPQTRETPLEW